MMEFKIAGRACAGRNQLPARTRNDERHPIGRGYACNATSVSTGEQGLSPGAPGARSDPRFRNRTDTHAEPSVRSRQRMAGVPKRVKEARPRSLITTRRSPQRCSTGGTHNPAAFDAYLRASKNARAYVDGKDLQAAIADYSEAIRLDPVFALAFAGRSRAYTGFAERFST
jgi:hypothetical protein